MNIGSITFHYCDKMPETIKLKRGKVWTKMVEHLPHKHQDMSSNPNATKKKRGGGEKKRKGLYFSSWFWRFKTMSHCFGACGGAARHGWSV
jgi:hypothetical protein